MIRREEKDWLSISPIILENLPKGVLLTTKANGQTDTMTIGFGTIGDVWGKPVFTVFVRESRFTDRLLNENGEFTVNIPEENEDVRKILGYCGTKSARDTDKIADLNLTLVEGLHVNVPAIVQLPLTLECKVIYKQKQDPAAIPKDVAERYYPQGDYHTAYTGEIVACYLLKEES